MLGDLHSPGGDRTSSHRFGGQLAPAQIVFAVAGNGIRFAEIGIPTRYMHSPSEMCHLTDIDVAVQLCVEFTRSECESTSDAF
jgi:putative aminopeptidase FrvX